MHLNFKFIEIISWNRGHMPTEISKELIEEFKDSFQVFDKDGDGFITANELSSVMSSLGQNPTDSEIADMINEVDADGDGRIDFPEFLTMMSRKAFNYDPDKELEDAFKVFDKNGDGFISSNELKQVLLSLGEKATDNDIVLMMKEADTNNDGKICFEEFKNMMRSK